HLNVRRIARNGELGAADFLPAKQVADRLDGVLLVGDTVALEGIVEMKLHPPPTLTGFAPWRCRAAQESPPCWSWPRRQRRRCHGRRRSCRRRARAPCASPRCPAPGPPPRFSRSLARDMPSARPHRRSALPCRRTCAT